MILKIKSSKQRNAHLKTIIDWVCAVDDDYNDDDDEAADYQDDYIIFLMIWFIWSLIIIISNK